MRHATPSAGAVNLAEVLPNSQFFGSHEIRFASCCGDSRHCRQGDLFAALVGSRGDGHNFAADAVEKGATALLAERMLPLGVPTCVVENSREAYGRICHALMDDPCNDMHVVGISGTYGKTTTAMLLTAVLESAGHHVGIASSLGYCDGDRVDMTVRSSNPTAPELVRWLAAMRDNDCSHAMVEAPSQGLANHSFAGTQMDGVILTNVRRAHMDLHGSVLAYRKIKQRMLSYLKPGGYAIINADDPASRFVLKDIQAPVLTFGIKNRAEMTATIIQQQHGEQTFLLTAGSESVPVSTKMVGQHHVYNCLAAASVGLIAGIDLSTIARGLSAVDELPGRLQRISSVLPFATYVDIANTPDSLAVALSSMKKITTGKLICVYGASGGGDADERPLLGRTVERLADLGILTRNNPRDEDALQIAHDVMDGYQRPAGAHWIPDRARAIGWALQQAKPGDTVLIAGRGNEITEIVDGRETHFDDREVAKFFMEDMARRQRARRKTA